MKKTALKKCAFGALALALTTLTSARAEQTTYCNPVDIDYQYNFEQEARDISFRSAADPVIVNHKGEYFLFATISRGWWHSKDLLHWRFVKPDVSPNQWPKEDMCAPAAWSAGGRMYLFQSTFDRRPIYVTDTPETGRLEILNPRLPLMPGAAGPWDPALFHDEDTGKWFMYFGSSNVYPVYGIELDPKNQLNYIGTASEMFGLRPELHGWERFGRDHRDTIKPFMEGAWMTKHTGKYYLQYAGPGTEFNVYANGTYIGEGPLGPWNYAPNNPVSYKPGGFVHGAGHGNTFQDNHGNFWNTGTPWVAVNFDTERRIAMFPAGFDKDGLLYSNTRFGDFPQKMPSNKWADRNELFAGWMLLSYKKPVTASSSRIPYGAVNVTDENPRTYWLSQTTNEGEWLTLDLEHECEVNAVQVNYTDHHSKLFHPGPNVYTQFRLRHSLDGKTWAAAADLTGEKRDHANAYVELPKPVKARFIRFEHVHVGAVNLAVSDIRVFGNGGGAAPATPANLQVRADSDPRNAFLTWEEVPGAVGYNILWGIQDDKLYQTYQVFGDQSPKQEIRALNASGNYSFAIEAFNESGVSKPSPVRRLVRPVER